MGGWRSAGLLRASSHLGKKAHLCGTAHCQIRPLVSRSSSDRTVQPERAKDRPPRFFQDRISPDGRIVTGGLPAFVPLEGAERQPGVPPTAPAVPPISEEQLTALVSLLLECEDVVVLTGAGCSTESNIPDYRGPLGAYATGFKPMTHQQFTASPAQRARYWARSFAGWHEFADVGPNAAHHALSRLQSRGWVGSIVTQNVDRLHHKAGSRSVLELHGTTHEVRCMDCGAVTPRADFQQTLAGLNPAAADAAALMRDRGPDSQGARERSLRLGSQNPADSLSPGGLRRRPDGDVEIPVRRPDGDVELQDAGRGFVVPPCTACGGILKPDVVFFGDSIPPPRSRRALEVVEASEAVLVVGSSLAVYSAYRLARAAKQAGARLALLNVGPTRADDFADLKVESLAGEALTRLATHPSLVLPRASMVLPRASTR